MASNEFASQRGSGRRLAGWLAWLGCVGLLAASVLVGSGPLARQQGWLVDGGSPSVAPEVIAQMHPQPVSLGAGVIDPVEVDQAAPADAGQLAQVMAATPPELPGRYAGAVANLGGGALLYDLDSAAALVPASTLKVMTSITALDALGPDHRFTTSVVATGPDTIVLVGGGDPLLSSTATSYPFASDVALPTTAELAAATAAALTAQGVASVNLGYDDSLFSGAVWHTDWPAADRAYVPPVSALVVDEAAGEPGVGSPAPAAAKTFADQLRAAGIVVNGEPVPASGAGGQQLAAVHSAPLSVLVQELLVHSDNFIGEMLLRQVGLAHGQPGSFEGGAAGVTAGLTSLGLWRDGQRIADGSGMSGNNRLTPAALVAALQLAAERPELSAVLAGMPVASATGTLATRFGDARSVPARGQVRAKTGTLDKVSGLAGYTETADGALLAFAFIGNELPTDQNVRGWFDHVAAALAGCDCVP